MNAPIIYTLQSPVGKGVVEVTYRSAESKAATLVFTQESATFSLSVAGWELPALIKHLGEAYHAMHAKKVGSKS